jgi:hypothetical protein
MSARSRSRLNWMPREEEIRTLFVERGWTWKQVMEYMKSNYGFQAT